MVKEEEILISQQTGQPTNQKRYKFMFATLQGDMGFGAKTGDLCESMVIYSVSADRFKTGGKYTLKLEGDE